MAVPFSVQLKSALFSVVLLTARFVGTKHGCVPFAMNMPVTSAPSPLPIFPMSCDPAVDGSNKYNPLALGFSDTPMNSSPVFWSNAKNRTELENPKDPTVVYDASVRFNWRSSPFIASLQ